MADKRVAFSGEELPIMQIQEYYSSSERALRAYCQSSNPIFVGYTIQELESKRDTYLAELDRSTSLSVLAAIEAHFRMDYLQRCYARERDALSRELRQLYGLKGKNASLSEDILERWAAITAEKALIAELRAALNYRHWLAHGRYWLAKLGRKYDFFNMLSLALSLQTALGLKLGA